MSGITDIIWKRIGEYRRIEEDMSILANFGELPDNIFTAIVNEYNSDLLNHDLVITNKTLSPIGNVMSFSYTIEEI
jgi:hypothetical protein